MVTNAASDAAEESIRQSVSLFIWNHTSALMSISRTSGVLSETGGRSVNASPLSPGPFRAPAGEHKPNKRGFVRDRGAFRQRLAPFPGAFPGPAGGKVVSDRSSPASTRMDCSRPPMRARFSSCCPSSGAQREHKPNKRGFVRDRGAFRQRLAPFPGAVPGPAGKHFLGSLKAYVETGTGQPW
jgi:hypothetical protein